jgi:hypothetical protein
MSAQTTSLPAASEVSLSAVRNATIATRREAAEIARLCVAAGQAHAAAGYILASTPVDAVRRALATPATAAAGQPQVESLFGPRSRLITGGFDPAAATAAARASGRLPAA